MYKRLLSVAPMMDYTDRHFRYFLRLISQHTWLYTEMVTTGAILHGDLKHLLAFDESEHPVALQLGGSEPGALAECAKIGADYGYDEINLNVGCPSDRVQSAKFGACLMAEPLRVAECVMAMREKVAVPVTVKCRTGVDDQDSYEDLSQFISEVAGAGCDTFIIHARKAWLKGLSPKENREVPPLQYDFVYRLKKDFPQLTLVINGGILNLEQARQQLLHVDGVMIGRAAYQHPYFLAEADRLLYGEEGLQPSRTEILEHFLMYVERQLSQGATLSGMIWPILGLFKGAPGARAWRRCLSENARFSEKGVDVIREANRMLAVESLQKQ